MQVELSDLMYTENSWYNKVEFKTACYDIDEDIIENKYMHIIIESIWWCIN